MTGVSYGIEIHAIAKEQYPRYRSPNGTEAFDKGRILGRYQSGMDQIKGTARAKLGQSCFQCKRVASPCSRTSGVVAARGRGFVSSYLVAKLLSRTYLYDFVCDVTRFTHLITSQGCIVQEAKIEGGGRGGSKSCKQRVTASSSSSSHNLPITCIYAQQTHVHTHY